VDLLVIGNSYEVVKAILEHSSANNFCVLTHNIEIKKLSDGLGVPAFSLTEFNVRLEDGEFESTNFDLGICVNFEILPEKIFGLPRFGSVNIHPASLPRFSGRYPFPMLIESELSYSEVCIHKIETKADSGKVLSRMRYPIQTSDYYLDWLKTVSKVSIDLILEFTRKDFNAVLLENNSLKNERHRSLPPESRKPRRELFCNSNLSLYDAIRINSRLGGTTLLKSNGDPITIFLAENRSVEFPRLDSYRVKVVFNEFFLLDRKEQKIVKVLAWDGSIADGDVLFRLIQQNASELL